MTAKHFPGPWEIDDDTCSEEGDLAIVVEGAHIITVLGPGHFPCLDDREAREADERRVEATANLVVAAPDLLAACRALLAAMPYGDDEQPDMIDGEPDGAYWPEVLAARAAIAKAEP